MSFSLKRGSGPLGNLQKDSDKLKIMVFEVILSYFIEIASVTVYEEQKLKI